MFGPLWGANVPAISLLDGLEYYLSFENAICGTQEIAAFFPDECS